jgi:ribosomal protein S18 acetylase RimI-like enzyme
VASPIEVRSLAWPSDLAPLERLDTTFSTDVVYDVQALPRGFVLVERAISPAFQKQYLVAWDELITSSVAIVAERDGVLVGVAALQYAAWDRRAVISHLYVDRAARGQGVGTDLMRELRVRANALHARCLWVETQNVNAPAIRFYERCGLILSGLDISLYDPQDIVGETALFFASRSADGNARAVSASRPAVS